MFWETTVSNPWLVLATKNWCKVHKWPKVPVQAWGVLHSTQKRMLIGRLSCACYHRQTNLRIIWDRHCELSWCACCDKHVNLWIVQDNCSARMMTSCGNEGSPIENVWAMRVHTKRTISGKEWISSCWVPNNKFQKRCASIALTTSMWLVMRISTDIDCLHAVTNQK